MLIALTIVLIALYIFLLSRILRRRAAPRVAVYLVSGAVLALLRVSVLFYLSHVLHNHYMGSPLSFLSYLLLPEALLLSDLFLLLNFYPHTIFFDALFLVVGSFLITSPLLVLVTRKADRRD